MEQTQSALIQELAELRRATWELVTECKRILPAIQAGAALPADELLQAMMNAEKKLTG